MQKSLSQQNTAALIQDYIVGVVYDKTKDVYLMTNHRTRGLWFPYSERRINETSLQTVKRLLEHIVSYDSEQVQLIKVRSAKTLPFKGYDTLFYSIVPKQNAINVWLNGKCDDLERNLISMTDNVGYWLTTNQLRQLAKQSHLLGMEPLALAKQFKDNFNFKSNSSSTVIFEEVSIPIIDTNTKTIAASSANNTTSNVAETLVISAKFTPQIQEKLFEEFHLNVIPSDYLNYETFRILFVRKDVEINRLNDYFRAFDCSQRSYLTFVDYLLGMAAMDPTTQHGGVPAEQRCRYIFRLYNVANNSRMTFDEFKTMVRDIHKNKGQNLTGEILYDEAAQMFRSFGLRLDQTLGLMDFLSGVGQLRFRGTSVLFRLTVSVADMLKRSSTSPIPLTPTARSPSTITMPRRSSRMGPMANAPSNTSIDQTIPYEIATHIVKVKKTGVVIDVTSLYDLEVNGAVSGSTALFLDDANGKYDRLNSQDCFNQRTHANEMLNGLRYFERGSKEGGPALKEPFTWGKVDMGAMARCLMVLCKQIYTIFLKEDRMIRVSSACYILGDLHGNFRDLTCFEKTFWRLGPVLTPASLLFLGDYVDRGQEGVEVVAYLFAQKVLCPHKVHLLRGNHELRNVQDMFQFHTECRRKFGVDLGEQVWEEINRCFDTMPICALVDDRVLCVHGGIPSLSYDKNFFAAVASIPCPLRDPETESPIAWELLWNDPLSKELNMEAKELDMNKGFVYNVRRGTGFFFSAKALNDFLHDNSLSYVVRAHEVQQNGFK
ncbi:unnamed protein product [Didymodactylos carnosus]|nr:unnamed protein product [Didymodactylos carnosus]CAF4159938.1 unnamed protein product [Didymodactylos carnosus]